MRRNFDVTLCSWILLVTLLLPTLGAAAAGESHALTDVQRAAEAAVRDAVPLARGTLHARAVELDARLNVARCAHALQARSAPVRAGMNRAIVAVSCAGPTAWTINVPVVLEVEQHVLVARVPIARGTQVAAHEVAVELRRVPGTTTRYLAATSELRNQTTRRPLAVGELVTVDALTPAIIVKRGQALTVIAESGGVAIRVAGRAMADAALNGRVRVQNANSLKIIEGIVESADTVRVAW